MHPSDKDFDRLFREAADRFEPDDSMLSWGRLEKNLSGQLPERPPGPPRRFGFRPMVWVPAAVLFAGLSFFLINKNQLYRSLSTHPVSANTVPVSPARGGEVKPAPNTSSDRADSLRENPSAVDNDRPGAPVSVVSGKPSGPVAADLPRGRLSRDFLRKKTARGKNINAGADPATSNVPSLTETSNRSRAARELIVKERTTRNENTLRQEQATASGFRRPLYTHRKIRGGNPARGRLSSVTPTDFDDGNGTGRTLRSGELSRADGSDGSEALSAKEAQSNLDSGFRSPTNTPRAEFAHVHLPGLSPVASPAIRTDDEALRKIAAQNKSLTLPSRSVQVRKPLTFGLVMGPDYTDGGETSSQLGNSVGLSVSYYLSGRLSINSGLLYAVKSYSAKGEDFQPPVNPLRGPGTYPHYESANGSVYLFEVPLSLRYDFPVDGKTKFFINAGLSSYLPVKERFTTYFRDQGRIYAWRHENDNPASHWFGIGHFSGGIERDLGKGLSFQAEPYFNLPFTNVCTGNVKLNTYGLLFSIRYTPVLRRKKG